MTEKELRQRTFEANLQLVEHGLVLFTWGNVSLLDKENGIWAIKPSGVPYATMRPEDMVLMDMQGNPLPGQKLRPSSDAPTHCKLYQSFEEVGGIVHTHSTYATAFAQAGMAIPCLGTTHADYFYGEIPCTRAMTGGEIERAYEWETGTVIAEAMQDKNPLHVPGVLVKNHGPFAWGKDEKDAVYHAVVMEEVAKMAYIAYSVNPNVQQAPQNLQDKHFMRKHGPNAYYGQGGK